MVTAIHPRFIMLLSSEIKSDLAYCPSVFYIVRIYRKVVEVRELLPKVKDIDRSIKEDLRWMFFVRLVLEWEAEAPSSKGEIPRFPGCVEQAWDSASGRVLTMPVTIP